MPDRELPEGWHREKRVTSKDPVTGKKYYATVPVEDEVSAKKDKIPVPTHEELPPLEYPGKVITKGQTHSSHVDEALKRAEIRRDELAEKKGMRAFNKRELEKLFKPSNNSSGEDNGQVTIIGGSSLFHGAPLLSLKVASRVVDMVFFASPEKSIGMVAGAMKSKLLSFIRVPWEEVEHYIEKSEAVLIGPGFLRFKSEKVPHGERTHICDEACQITRKITEDLLKKFPKKKWVIDAGSLQVMEASWIPNGTIVTPNKKESALLFGNLKTEEAAKRYKCTIVLKGPTTFVCSQDECVEVKGGNPGMTKGGTGDVQAGLTVALLAKNDPLLSASAAAYITKAAADELFKKVGVNYNADDLADIIPETFARLTR